MVLVFIEAPMLHPKPQKDRELPDPDAPKRRLLCDVQHTEVRRNEDHSLL